MNQTKRFGNRMILFSLMASVIPGVAVQAQDASSELPPEVREWLERDQVQRWAAMIAEGDSIFNAESCARCHGPAGVGGRWGPDLTDGSWVQGDGTLESIQRTIFWGVRREEFADPERRFEMNPGGGIKLDWDQYSSLAAYVWTLSKGTHLPGLPQGLDHQ